MYKKSLGLYNRIRVYFKTLGKQKQNTSKTQLYFHSFNFKKNVIISDFKDDVTFLPYNDFSHLNKEKFKTCRKQT